MISLLYLLLHITTNLAVAFLVDIKIVHGSSIVLSGIYPVSGADFEALAAAVERLTLNDASVTVKRENSAALSAGFRCGCTLSALLFAKYCQDAPPLSSLTTYMPATPVDFKLRCIRFLGLLHMEVFLQRLEQEHGANVITTSPTVPYVIEHIDGTRQDLQNPSQVSIRAETLLYAGFKKYAHQVAKIHSQALFE